MTRLLIETVFSLLTKIYRLIHLRQKVRAYFEMRLTCTVALFDLPQRWNGLNFDENRVSHLSLAEFIVSAFLLAFIQTQSEGFIRHLTDRNSAVF